jgi:hypothetical protein
MLAFKQLLPFFKVRCSITAVKSFVKQRQDTDLDEK